MKTEPSSGKNKNSHHQGQNLSRREFFKNGVLGSALLVTSPYYPLSEINSKAAALLPGIDPDSMKPYTPLLDLAPAKWIWYPMECDCRIRCGYPAEVLYSPDHQ